MSEEPRAEEPEAPNWQEFIRIAKLPIIVVVSVLVVFGAIPFVLDSLLADGKLSNAASFGDSFGFVNAVFSGLALAGVVAAIVLQSQQLKMQRHELGLQIEELKLQREELRLTREEMKLSVKAQQESGEALSEQVKFLFLTAYLNGLKISADYHNEMTTVGHEALSKQRAHFKHVMMISSVSELIGRIRPMLAEYMKGRIVTKQTAIERLKEVGYYVKWVLTYSTRADRNITRYCQAAAVDAFEELMMLRTSLTAGTEERRLLEDLLQAVFRVQKRIGNAAEIEMPEMAAIRNEVEGCADAIANLNVT